MKTIQALLPALAFLLAPAAVADEPKPVIPDPLKGFAGLAGANPTRAAGRRSRRDAQAQRGPPDGIPATPRSRPLDRRRRQSRVPSESTRAKG